MGAWYKILILCGLITASVTASAQTVETTYTGKYLTFTANNKSSLTLHSYSTNAAAYQWYKNGSMINGALYKDFTATQEGKYTVTAFNAEGCPSDHSDSVLVVFKKGSPGDTQPGSGVDSVDLMANINPTNTKPVLGDQYSYIITADNKSKTDGTQVQLSYTIPANLVYISHESAPGIITYNEDTHTLSWVIGTLEKSTSQQLYINVKVAQSGLAQSKVTITGSQADPDLQNNTFIASQQINSLMVPNIFTPNGDGLNDSFIIDGLTNYSENEIHIINRFGNEVYTKKNYKNDWSGDSLMEGTYFYMLKAKAPSGAWETYKGYLTLLRSRI